MGKEHFNENKVIADSLIYQCNDDVGPRPVKLDGRLHWRRRFFSTGKTNYNPGGTPLKFYAEGEMAGFFVGYNSQSGGRVVGAELAYYDGAITEVNWPDYEYTQAIDFKARFGRAGNIAFVSTLVGLSFAQFDMMDEFGSSIQTGATGLLLGMGADVAVGDNFFVGSEVLYRTLANNEYTIGSNFFDVSLRGGYRF